MLSAKSLGAGMQSAKAVFLQAPALPDEAPGHERPLKLAIHNSSVQAHLRSTAFSCVHAGVVCVGHLFIIEPDLGAGGGTAHLNSYQSSLAVYQHYIDL